MSSAKVNLTNARKAVLAQQKLYQKIGTSIAELRTDVDNTAAILADQCALNTIRDGKIIQNSDNLAAVDERVTGLEALNHEIDWERSAVITAVVAVISAFIIYTLVFSLRWDPLLEIEGGTINGEISDAARSIMNWHVAIFTFVVTAFTFFGCVCFIAKRKPGSTTTTTAPAEQPTQVVRVVEVVEVAEPLTAPVPPSRPKSLDWVAPAQAQ